MSELFWWCKTRGHHSKWLLIFVTYWDTFGVDIDLGPWDWWVHSGKIFQQLIFYAKHIIKFPTCKTDAFHSFIALCCIPVNMPYCTIMYQKCTRIRYDADYIGPISIQLWYIIECMIIIQEITHMTECKWYDVQQNLQMGITCLRYWGRKRWVPFSNIFKFIERNVWI